MCGRCDGEPYRGVAALFNGDLQAGMEFEDRKEWLVISSRVILFIGEVTMMDDEYCLVRDCDSGYAMLSEDEVQAINLVGRDLSRNVRLT